jgi:thiol-disulfide isomerase/thioredoxin
MKQVLFFTAFLSTIFTTHTMAQTGECNTKPKEILAGENGDLFQKELDTYKVNETALANIDFKDISLKVVLGNWCEDSQREVPRLIKILELPQLEKVSTHYYLVNREKFCADPAVQKLEVKYVPAIIFYRNGKEIGRIIETPEGSLEGNIAKIVNQ